jgi:4-amino-4-deoxy-L-arabinose transferase-like glycosyltransferase
MVGAKRISGGGGGRDLWWLLIASAALVLRLGFVAWAPARVAGDAHWYNLYARLVSSGTGYVELDGSPVVQWMPGWPYFLAGVYSIFGPSIRAGMVVNAFLGAATAALLVPLGTRLFRADVGRAAGLLYALWPGVVYFAATLMSESLFNFLLVASLLIFSVGVDRSRRLAWCAAGGFVFGLASLVKAESLGIVPVLLVFLWLSRPSRSAFLSAVAAAGLAGAVALAPWAARNLHHFDRLLLTSAGGGMNVHIGNHAGATGGEMFNAASRYSERHKGANRAETMLNMNAAGWKDAWAFAKSDPAQELRILARKLFRTYSRDDGGVLMLRGPGTAKTKRFLDESETRLLRWIANGFWYLMLLAVAAGLATLRAWPVPTRVLCLGLIASFAAIHLIFLGGPRFHVAEIPILALIAGAGLTAACRKRWPAGGRGA